MGDDNELIITELPPMVWTEEYREELNKWILEKEKEKEKESKRPCLQMVNDVSDNDRVEIHVMLEKQSKHLLEGNVEDPQSRDY